MKVLNKQPIKASSVLLKSLQHHPYLNQDNPPTIFPNYANFIESKYDAMASLKEDYEYDPMEIIKKSREEAIITHKSRLDAQFSDMEAWKDKNKNKGIYKQREHKGHKFGEELDAWILYTLKSYAIAFGMENIKPSIGTIATACRISRRTTITYLNSLQKRNIIGWLSGKKWYETNKFTLNFPKTKVIPKPLGYVFEKKLWFSINTLLKTPLNRVTHSMKNNIYLHIANDFAHQLVTSYRFILVSVEAFLKREYPSKKSAVDPPKPRYVPKKRSQIELISTLLLKFNLSKRELFIFLHYGVGNVTKALGLLDWLSSKKNYVPENEIAFLISKCKEYKLANIGLYEIPKNKMKWVCDYLKMKKVVVADDSSSYCKASSHWQTVVQFGFPEKNKDGFRIKIKFKGNYGVVERILDSSAPNMCESLINFVDLSIRETKYRKF